MSLRTSAPDEFNWVPFDLLYDFGVRFIQLFKHARKAAIDNKAGTCTELREKTLICRRLGANRHVLLDVVQIVEMSVCMGLQNPR